VDRSWFFVALDGADDPAVLTGNGVSANHANWTQVSATFSEFAYGAVLASSEGTKTRKERSNLWLRTPAEPLCPPVIDCLIERFGEPEVTPRPGNVSTYAWRPTGGTVRVTADEPTLAGGLSAWWVHAKTPERLAEFARLLLPWGTLRDTLRADTEPAQDVLKRAREV
jgi:hypothetical protein